ncbi:MAG: hypothetical protein HY774_07195 [Acidobacteria bacterium]|nr:hypothetical protein [Acidobacteriota bacterium]
MTKPSLNNLVPAPIRAQTLHDLCSGGCASKQAAHRLLSGAHPGGDRCSKTYRGNDQ